jgi:hypothetical protein
MKILAWLFCLVLVLEVPLDIWRKAPEVERDRLRTLATIEHCQKEAKKGASKWRIFEVIKNGMWQLHIEEIKTEV